MNHELSDVQAGFRKGRRTRDQIANICWIIEKVREFQKQTNKQTSISALLAMPKPLTVWITINCGNSKRDGNPRAPDPPPEKSVCRSGSNSLNWTWKKRLVPNRKSSTSRLYTVTLII